MSEFFLPAVMSLMNPAVLFSITAGTVVGIIVGAMPGLATTRPEATYLSWIDCREMMAQRQVEDPAAFFEAAGVGLSDGRFFGAPGWLRRNFGCPRAPLDEALARALADVPSYPRWSDASSRAEASAGPDGPVGERSRP